MKRLFRLAIATLVCSSAIAQDRPVPPAEAPGKMTLPPGFKATLFAGEPDVVQPIAFTFDDRGRLWVVECLSYPHWSLDGTGHDRVIMFEDTDGDGKHDVRHVVFDQGSNLTGIELGHGGIWLCSTPNLVFIPCDFNADKPVPTGKPEIVLDGWNVKDTKHNIFNNLIWGPDGWLYGCNGIQSQSKVGRPGTPAGNRIEMNGGVWRYHPIRRVFEVVCHGTTNPFGLDYDQYGELFITNCVIKHLFHVIPGAHYDRMYGLDINPYSYELMHSVADYIHWAGGDWTTSRGNKPEHSDAGGGHAHVGAMVYLGDNFPAEYRNTLFTCNLHGNRLNRDVLKRHGSGYKSERAPDFLFANDPWFRGIAIHAGPDGGVYVSDWCDTGECHNYDKADITNGRIHKVAYGTPRRWTGDVSKLSDVDLIKLQAHANDWFARHARRVLQERGHTGKLDPRTPYNLSAALQNAADPIHRLRFAWAVEQLGDPEGGRVLLTDKANPAPVRAWGLRILLEHYADALQANRTVPDNWIDPALPYDSPEERLALASGLYRVPTAKRRPLLTRLLTALRPEDAQDANLPQMTWYAVEPTIGPDPAWAVDVIRKSPLARVRELTARKLTAVDHGHIPALVALAAGSKDTAVQRDVLNGIQEGLGGVRSAPAPAGWAEAAPVLLASKSADVKTGAMILAVTFGDETAIAAMTKTVTDPAAEVAARTTALRVLLRRGKPELLPVLQQLVSVKALRAEAIRGLAAFNDPGTPSLLLKVYPTLTDSEKEDAVQTLASRPAWALALLDAVEAGTVPRRDVSVFVARQMQGLKDKRVGERLAKVWGQLEPASTQRAALTVKYKSILSDNALAKADLSKGRQQFVKNCASCHKLYDEGGDVGPGLTGSQRSNLDYLLENVLDPSAVVPSEYQVNVIQMQDGRVINGIIKAETDKALTVRTANETIVVPKPEIESRKVSKLSMMPEGIFEKMTDAEVRDLVAYLRGKEQVPLPK
jgi:putative membrane-bound dehydrogenase-like protein